VSTTTAAPLLSPAAAVGTNGGSELRSCDGGYSLARIQAACLVAARRRFLSSLPSAGVRGRRA